MPFGSIWSTAMPPSVVIGPWYGLCGLDRLAVFGIGSPWDGQLAIGAAPLFGLPPGGKKNVVVGEPSDWIASISIRFCRSALVGKIGSGWFCSSRLVDAPWAAPSAALPPPLFVQAPIPAASRTAITTAAMTIQPRLTRMVKVCVMVTVLLGSAGGYGVGQRRGLHWGAGGAVGRDGRLQLSAGRAFHLWREPGGFAAQRADLVQLAGPQVRLFGRARRD